jgi:acetate kinase
MTGCLLILNAGSTSVKFQLFGPEAEQVLVAAGQVAGIGTAPRFKAGNDEKLLAAGSSHEEALAIVLGWVQSQGYALSAAGHRVVHGGTEFVAPVEVTEKVLEKLRALAPLAPLHQPHNLAAIDILAKLQPDLPQVACFDTAFHAGQDALFTTYALPQSLRDKGIRRYGFHGLSYEWIAEVLKREHPALATGRVIAAHLGGGSSLCALKNGKSVTTSLGMTALDGLPMTMRCGSLDPGAVIYLVRELGLSADEVEHLLYGESGLKGLSGTSGDVKTLLASEAPAARFALDYFVERTAEFMGQMAVALGGVDGLVFTGGIGENAHALRDRILEKAAFLGRFESLVIPANEERMMARHVRACLGNS